MSGDGRISVRPGFHIISEDNAKQLVRRFWEEYHDMRNQMIANVAQLDKSGAESFDDLSAWGRAQLEHRHSWMFGYRQVTEFLNFVYMAVDEGQHLSPLTFLDLMYLVDRLPLVKAQAYAHGVRFPAPDPNWLSGWYEGDGSELIMSEPVRNAAGEIIAIPRSLTDEFGTKVIGKRAE